MKRVINLTSELSERCYLLLTFVLVTLILSINPTIGKSQGTAVFTDKDDYLPNDTVFITGEGYGSIESVMLVFDEGPKLTHPSDTIYATTDSVGKFATWMIITPQDTGQIFTLTATGLTSGLSAFTTFTDAGANLEHAFNGTWGTPVNPVTWGTATGTSSNDHYVQGGTIPYRIVCDALTIGNSYTVEFEWDTKRSGEHAIDFINSYFYNSAQTIDPLFGTGVTGSPSTFAIPAPSSTGSPVAGQPATTFNALTSSDRMFTIWKGSITAAVYVSQASLSSSTTTTKFKITFTAAATKAVIAFGGHLATTATFGTGMTDVSSDNYRTRITKINTTTLTGDRRVNASAVTIPDCSKTCSKATEFKECDPPKTFNKTVVATGSVTWNSLVGTSGGYESNAMTKTVKITGTGTITVSGFLSINNGTLYIDGPKLIIPNGSLTVDGDGILIAKNGSIRVSGDFLQSSGKSTVCVTNCEVEVGDEQSNGYFSTGGTSSSADFRNSGGQRYLENVCLNVSHNLNNIKGSDVFVDVCGEIGDRGATNLGGGTLDASDAGVWENDGYAEVFGSQFIVANKIQNFSTETMKVCNSHYRTLSGDLINEGYFYGCDFCAWVDDLHQIKPNGGSLYVEWDGRRGTASGPIFGLPANSSVAQISTCFSNCCPGVCTNPPTANAGADRNACPGAVSLTGTIGGAATTGTWISNGSGSFGTNGINATYNTVSGDIGNIIRFIFTTDDPDGTGPCVSANDTVFITIKIVNDNNACTTDACSAGVVTHTQVNTDDNNVCTTDRCDTVTGPYHVAVGVDDNNACTTDACDPVTGVSHTAVNTNDNNVCTTDACDPVTGVSHSTINTNDNNACTVDACDPVTGVSHTAVNTNDNNACTTDACNTTTGAVTHTAVDTNDNNVCTTDACDPLTGVSHTAVNTNDNNACTVDACDPVTGVSHTAVNTNDNN
ncbi:MAG: hypothetical protein ABI772_12020, partial [Bacteroidota bacterium]